MAKLTRAQALELRAAINHLRRAQGYLFSEQVAIARRDTMATTTLHYQRPSDGACLFEVNKHYGSDLTGLGEGLRLLSRFIEEHDQP